MSNSSFEYKEIRFIIGELTDCYVLAAAHGDSPIGVQGWHHKAFPPSKSCQDILGTFVQEAPILWPQAAPPQ